MHGGASFSKKKPMKQAESVIYFQVEKWTAPERNELWPIKCEISLLYFS